jgi:hypothetical protein
VNTGQPKSQLGLTGNYMKINNQNLTQHASCEVYVDTAPVNRHGQLTPHAAALRCRCHNKWLKWISQSELDQLSQLDVDFE